MVMAPPDATPDVAQPPPAETAPLGDAVAGGVGGAQGAAAPAAGAPAAATPEGVLPPPAPTTADLPDDILLADARVATAIAAREAAAADAAKAVQQREYEQRAARWVTSSEAIRALGSAVVDGYLDERAATETVQNIVYAADQAAVVEFEHLLAQHGPKQLDATDVAAIHRAPTFEARLVATWQAHLNAAVAAKRDDLRAEVEAEYKATNQVATQNAQAAQAALARAAQAAPTAGVSGPASFTYGTQAELHAAHASGAISTAQFRALRQSGQFAALPTGY